MNDSGQAVRRDPEFLADLLRVLLAWTWTAALASSALAGPGMAPSRAAFLALAAVLFGFVTGARLGRPLALAPEERAGDERRARRRARAMLLWTAAGTAVAAVVTMGAGMLPALSGAAAYFSGREAGVATWRALGVLAFWASVLGFAASSGRKPATFDSVRAEIGWGLAAWAFLTVLVAARGAPGPGEVGRAALWVVAFVASAIWALAWARHVEGWRESGGEGRATGAPGWFTAGASALVVAVLAVACVLLVPGAFRVAAGLAGAVWSLFTMLVYYLALPIGYVVAFIVNLLRPDHISPMPSETAFGPLVREPDATRVLTPLQQEIDGALRLVLAAAAVALLAWLAVRIWRRLAEPGEAVAGFVETRRRIEAGTVPPRPAPVRPPSSPARRAFWRVQQRALRAGLPGYRAAREVLARAAEAAEAANAASAQHSPDAGGTAAAGYRAAEVRDAASRGAAATARDAARELLAAYWVERYGHGGDASERNAPERDAAGRSAAALARAADVLEGGIREASRRGLTPETGA